jgi:nucleoside-diphosphate-sugar epimerase
MDRLIAVTGATGFIGRCLVRRLVEEGWAVRALCRAPRRAPAGVEVVLGSLEDGVSLPRLLAGSRAAVHLAGLVKARRASEFEWVNARGVADMVEALLGTSPRPRLLLVSSLAARHPEVSVYGASKRQGEEVALSARDEGVELCVVRPPAVYGPGDRGTLPIFQQLKRGFLVIPAVDGARFSLLFVDDLVDLLVALLAASEWRGQVMEPDDGCPGGYGWSDLALIAERQLGRRVRVIRVPGTVARLAATMDQAVARVRGNLPVVGIDKVHEMYHPDWVSRADDDSPAPWWTARVPFETGVTRTMAWYEERRWL